jgi:hypothetical protein
VISVVEEIVQEIKLTRGMVAIVDDEDFERLNQWKWYAQITHTKTKPKFYACRSERTRKSHKHIFMHRYLMDVPTKISVDHKDGNSLNNQKTNLRLCNQAQNNYNSIKRKDGKIRFKGVSWWGNKYYRCRIEVDGKTKVSYFHIDIEAALEYDRLALQYYGEFAKTNAMLGLLP